MFRNKFKYYAPLGWIAGILVVLSLAFSNRQQPDIQKWEGDTVKIAKFEFKDNKFDTANLRTELSVLNIECKDVVYAQAKLETGNFKSKLFLENNNLFGFRNKKGQWMKFNSWRECCKYYKQWQETRYKGGDYYKFLVAVGYAEDTGYVKKVKRCLR